MNDAEGALYIVALESGNPDEVAYSIFAESYGQEIWTSYNVGYAPEYERVNWLDYFDSGGRGVRERPVREASLERHFKDMVIRSVSAQLVPVQYGGCGGAIAAYRICLRNCHDRRFQVGLIAGAVGAGTSAMGCWESSKPAPSKAAYFIGCVTINGTWGFIAGWNASYWVSPCENECGEKPVCIGPGE